MLDRTITSPVPKPARGRRWLAAGLMEAPDVGGSPGEWESLEAVAIPTEGDPVPDTISTRHAQYASGWYRLYWHDDGQNTRFGPAIFVDDNEGSATGGRWN